VTSEIRIYSDPETLGAAAARAVAERIVTRLSHAETFAIALAGGRTPINTYRYLATSHRDAIPWTRVHFYWSDERYVPPDDPANNYGVAMAELLGRVPVPAANVHPMSTQERDADAAAMGYESILRREFGPDGPTFDLTLLGLGSEGHTASLFPGSSALGETRRWVVPALAPATPALRLTLTLRVLNLSREVYFIVAGAEKAPALAAAYHRTASPADCPAAGVRPTAGRTVWWVDVAAAARLRAMPAPDDPKR
jgi:6-phosphogluconolactonase